MHVFRPFGELIGRTLTKGVVIAGRDDKLTGRKRRKFMDKHFHGVFGDEIVVEQVAGDEKQLAAFGFGIQHCAGKVAAQLGTALSGVSRQGKRKRRIQMDIGTVQKFHGLILLGFLRKTRRYKKRRLQSKRLLLLVKIEFFLELIYSSACINEFLLAREERMALRADINTKLRLGGTSLKRFAACTFNGSFNVFRMDSLLHLYHSYSFSIPITTDIIAHLFRFCNRNYSINENIL